MKALIPPAMALFLTTLGLMGCAHPSNLVLTEPVGPLELTPQRTKQDTGHLIVYSAWDGLDTLAPEHRKHTPYRLYSDRIEREVWNRSGAFEANPEVVDLAPGRYQIEVEAADGALRRVPIAIDPGQTTVVYLDGTDQPVTPAPEDPGWIKEPNGFIVRGACSRAP